MKKKMNAYEFALLLKAKIASSPIAEIEVIDGINDGQFWSADISRVDHAAQKVVLASCLDYGGDSDWIDTLDKIKKWFLENGVRPRYKMVFENHNSKIFDSIDVIRKNVVRLIDISKIRK